MTPTSFGAEDYIALLPPILMVLFGCATLLLDVASRHDEKRRWLVLFNLTGLLLTGAAFLRQWQFIARSGQTHMTALQGSVTVDGLSLFTNALVWLAALGLVLMSYRYMETADEHCGEYYALALFAQAGMYFMASSTDLIALFTGLELTAISFYVLVGFTRADRRSNEASLKYLLLGALSSAFLLYGFSLFYGLSGSTQLSDIAVGANESSLAPFFVLGVITVTVGLLFKISAAPFHAWAPDAYDGAPTPVTAYLSVASKIASFAVLIRVLYVALPAARPVWEPIVIAAAVLSLTIGSIAALTQERLKRLFAYSAIAHAGYVLLGLVPGTQLGLQGIYVYLLVYAVMTLGAFALMTSLRRRGIAGEEISDLRGLAQTHPLHAALFAILLLSLAGMPPTAGFLGKYFIFAALVQTNHFALAAIAAVYVAVSLYFYFRLVREMYLLDAERREPLASSVGLRVMLFSTAALTLLIGLFPEPVLHAALPLAGLPR